MVAAGTKTDDAIPPSFAGSSCIALGWGFTSKLLLHARPTGAERPCARTLLRKNGKLAGRIQPVSLGGAISVLFGSQV